jgi:hypothetical protein
MLDRGKEARGERPDRELEPVERALQARPMTPAASVLALQRTIGNRAVGAMLARQADPAVTDPAAAEEALPTDASQAAGAQATVPGVGTIALDSVSQSASGRDSGVGGRGGHGPASQDIFFSSRVGEHSPKLQQLLIKGTAVDVVLILGGRQMTLKSAIVSSYQVAAGGEVEMETWSLNFQAIEHPK